MILPELRKVVTFEEEIHMDGGRTAEPILRILAAAAVVKNPWHGKGYVSDINPDINRMAPILGKLLTDRLIKMAGSGNAIEAYGKASIAGTDCELEHCSALIHTPSFRKLLP